MNKVHWQTEVVGENQLHSRCFRRLQQKYNIHSKQTNKWVENMTIFHIHLQFKLIKFWTNLTVPFRDLFQFEF